MMTDPVDVARGCPRKILRCDECPMTGDITIHFSDDSALKIARRDYEAVGFSWLMETIDQMGVQASERVDVIQYGRKVGELPAFWHPRLAKSRSFLFDYRKGDLTMQDGKWIASKSLGARDLDCLIGFVRKGQDDAE